MRKICYYFLLVHVNDEQHKKTQIKVFCLILILYNLSKNLLIYICLIVQKKNEKKVSIMISYVRAHFFFFFINPFKFFDRKYEICVSGDISQTTSARASVCVLYLLNVQFKTRNYYWIHSRVRLLFFFLLFTFYLTSTLHTCSGALNEGVSVV